MILRWNFISLISALSYDWVKRCILMLLLSAVLSPVALADDHADKINKVKSAFIYNIAKFVRWPEASQAQGHLQICFYRTDFLGKGFDSIVGRDVHGKQVARATVQDLTQTSGCSILLISNFDLPYYHEEYNASSPTVGLLTVADLTASSDHGKNRSGILLSLIRRGSSIGFEVSLQQVRERQLQMSSQLLKLAHILDKGER